MKEAYAVRRTVPPSAEIQAEIDKLLASRVADDPQKLLSELARLGARLIIQRAVEDEFDQWLGRARYERQPEAGPARRNGFRPRRVQTAEGELKIEMPQVREAAPFVSRIFYHGHTKRLIRSEPLKTMIISAFVRGLSVRDIESLCQEAGLGRTSKSTVARICSELHERFEAFKRRDLYEIKLVVLFLDAIFLPVRPSGPKEGVMCAWGFTENGERALVSVRLGMRETKEDWIELGRDLGGRGLQAPRLVLSDGAPGYEAAARCLTDDLDALVVHLRYPLRHRNRWQSTNLLERSLGEVRRRTKVMGRFPGETSCLSLVWAVLDLFFSHASNGATFTDLDRQHLYRIKPAGRGIIARRGGERRLSRPRGQPTPDRQPPGCTSARSKPV